MSSTLFWKKCVLANSCAVSSWSLCFKNNVSTWSSLATAFNTRPGRKLNLSFTTDNLGLFGLQELRTFDGFYLLKENAIAETDYLVKEACSTNRSRKMVSIFDELSNTLCRVADLSEFVRIAHPESSFAQAAENACISVSAIVEMLNTNQELFLSLEEVTKHGDKMVTTDVDRHVAALFQFDFEQSGIHLGEEKRKLVVALNNYILKLGQRFMVGAGNPRSVKKDSLPPNARHLFSAEGDNIVVQSLYADSPEELAREVAYKIYLHPDNQQQLCLDELLRSRNQLATLCGFPTYAHRAVKSSTAEEPAVVLEFLKTLSDKLKLRAEADFNTMKKMKLEENPLAKPLSPWDVPYLTNKAKHDWLRANSREFSPYFSLGGCMEGLNRLFNSLYGITLVNANVSSGETWAPDVYKLAVTHESEGLLGHIYCDFYERPNKPNQDCHFTIQGGKRLADGSYQNPIVVLMLNVPSARWTGPSLLTPSMVDNLFHEMGHAMHSMLARTEYQHVSGTRCCTDFAEVPSVLMEYFAADPRVLKTFAKHYVTGETMPEDMLRRLCASKRVFTASEMQSQVFYSLLDQTYHGEYPLRGSTTDVLAEVQERHYGIAYVPNTAWQLRFSHLVGYGAKYYAYLMSRAIASWIWQSSFAADPFSRAQGDKYRAHCLAPGGGKPTRHMIDQYLNLQVTPTSLAAALIQDIDSTAPSSS